MGPNLAGITRQVSAQWLIEFIRNPVEVMRVDMVDQGNMFSTCIGQHFLEEVNIFLAE